MRTIRAITLLLTLGMTAAAFGQGLPRDIRLNILEAVVQIIPYDDAAGSLVNWSGSGTIISPTGYVLTNYHVAGDLDRRIYYDWHAIFMTDPDFTDQPPEFWFWARYIAGDPTHDLAILKIEEWYDEEPIATDFVFPHVNVGDSNQLLPGDNITIVGYPGISGSTVTFTAGLMSGWVGEDFESGGKQWIKTDAKISHGNSGGGAFDEVGNLIGVPTAGRTVKYDELDVEEQAYVRPISLAWALIGPNVLDVARAGSNRTTAVVPPANNANQQTPLTPQTPQAPPSSGVGPCDFCLVGPVSVGTTATNVIGGVSEMINFHTYSIEVPTGTPTLTIALTGDADIDMAAKFGGEIQSWGDDGDWEYRDITETAGATFEISLPTPGTWYVDVIYYYDTGTANYSLSVQ
jgi:serine protease Do